jgi:2,4-diaminopentanoate dehydrogenase
MAEGIRVIEYGLGPIGSAAARLVAEHAGLSLVGAVDVDPSKRGRDAGEVIGLGRSLGFPVTATLAETLQRAKADAVLHTTNSYFDLFGDQLLEILSAGLDIVSTSEELSYPWLSHSEQAQRIDAAAKAAGKSVLGTGVNPGFLMDSLPLVLTGICHRVDHLEIRREQNASKRRGPFQAKIGSGMTPEAFQAKMALGRMGHVGLTESMGMLFSTLGRELVRYEAAVEPLLAERRVVTDFFDVPEGRVIGLKQVATGEDSHGEFVKLVFVAALDHPVDHDTVLIKGLPDLEVTLQGTHGDLATVAIAANALTRVCAAAPGLVTMADLPIVTWSSKGRAVA